MSFQLPNFSFTSTFLLFSSFIFFLIKLWKMKQSSSLKSNTKLPPSPPKLPVIGHLHLLVEGVAHHTVTRLARKFGPVMHLQLGETSTVVISSPEAAKEVLKVHDPACADRAQSIGMKIMTYDFSGFVFSQLGDHWKQMRKICILEMLSAKMVRSFASIRRDEVSRLIESLQSSTSSGQPVKLTEKVFAMMSSIVCRAAFGDVVNNKDLLIKLMKETVAMAGGFELPDSFPSFKPIHFLSRSKYKLTKIRRQLDPIFDAILEGHRSKLNDESGNEDLVGVLLRMKQSEDVQIPITDDNIKAVVFEIFGAGTDTSSTAIDWAMAELMRNPRVMAKVQDEVRQTLKGKGMAEAESHISTLKYLKLVIKETLRLHPPIPFLPRACREECKVDGYSIPKKSRVLVNVWSMGRDPKYWDEPESFRPERFENSSIDFLGNNFEYLPFGSGKRVCPGMGFGLASIELPLAQLLYNFDWKLPEGMSPDNIDMSESDGVAVTRKNALLLVPTPYPPSIEG